MLRAQTLAGGIVLMQAIACAAFSSCSPKNWLSPGGFTRKSQEEVSIAYLKRCNTHAQNVFVVCRRQVADVKKL